MKQLEFGYEFGLGLKVEVIVLVWIFGLFTFKFQNTGRFLRDERV
jgi:hypothetical protein